MILVGVHGQIGAGKDEVARHLIARYGFVRVGHSDALKAEVAAKFRRTLKAHLRDVGRLEPWASEDDVTREIHDALWVHRTGVSRALLQEMGTEVRRADDPDYWVRAWVARIQGLERVVAPDVRFPNEASTVRALGGVLMRVVRAGQDQSDHESELALAGWTDWDVEIDNGGTLQQIREVVDQWARGFPALKEERP